MPWCTLGADEQGPGRRRRGSDPAHHGHQPARPRLRRRSSRRPEPRRWRWPLAATPTRSSWTSASPTSTASTSSEACGAGRPCRSSSSPPAPPRRQKVAALDAGRQRLRHQAVRHGRADGPSPRRPASDRPRRGGGGGRDRRTSPSTWPPSASARTDRDVRLTATEWQVVEILARNAGTPHHPAPTPRSRCGASPTPRPTTSASSWLPSDASSSPTPAHPRYFITEPGSGIRFVPEGASEDADPTG